MFVSRIKSIVCQCHRRPAARETVAAFASLLIAAPCIYFVSPYLNVFIPGLNLFQYFYTHIAQLILYELAFGIIIGGFSSFFAVRRYLRN